MTDCCDTYYAGKDPKQEMDGEPLQAAPSAARMIKVMPLRILTGIAYRLGQFVLK